MLLLDLARLPRLRRVQNHREMHTAVIAQKQPLHLTARLSVISTPQSHSNRNGVLVDRSSAQLQRELFV